MVLRSSHAASQRAANAPKLSRPGPSANPTDVTQTTRADISSANMAFFPLSQGGFTTSTPVCTDADDLLRAILDTGNRLSEVSARLQPTAARSSRATIDRLERAMMKAYHVAVFIRRNYDSRERDESELEDLLEQTVDAFQEAHDIVAAGWRKLGEIHALAGETAEPVIKHAREEIVRVRQNAVVELTAFQGQFDAARKSADQAYRNIKMESQAYKHAQDKYEEDLQKCANGTLVSTLSLHTGYLQGPPLKTGPQLTMNRSRALLVC